MIMLRRLIMTRWFWRFFRRSPFLLQLAMAAAGMRILRRAVVRRFR